MLGSCRKLLRIPVTHRKAFCSYGVIGQNFNPKEFAVYSESEVKKPDFDFFNVHDIDENDEIYSGDGWVDYADDDGITFRMARYVHPPKGWVSVHVYASTEEDPETLIVCNSTAAAVKRSDEGILLNSCAVKLGSMDLLDSECQGAYFGMLMSQADEKVQLRTDSVVLKHLLVSGMPHLKVCQDVVHEVRSMISEKRRQGGVFDVKLVDWIANFLPNRMAKLPNQDLWSNREKEPLYFNRLEDLKTQELRTIVLEDKVETPSYAKKYVPYDFEGWYIG